MLSQTIVLNTFKKLLNIGLNYGKEFRMPKYYNKNITLIKPQIFKVKNTEMLYKYKKISLTKLF